MCIGHEYLWALCSLEITHMLYIYGFYFSLFEKGRKVVKCQFKYSVTFKVDHAPTVQWTFNER